MRSGMTANVSFQVAARKGVLFLPAEAVKKTPDGTAYVLTQDPESPAERLQSDRAPRSRPASPTASASRCSPRSHEGDSILLPQLRLGAKPPGTGNPFSPSYNQQKRPPK